MQRNATSSHSYLLFRFVYRGYRENPEGKYEFRLRGPQLVLAGPYSIKGRILILPITGNGYSNFTLCKSELDVYPSNAELIPCFFFVVVNSGSRIAYQIHWQTKTEAWQNAFVHR